MKKLLSILLLSLAFSATGQIPLLVDTNGFLRIAPLDNGRNTNFFRTNMFYLLRSLSNDPIAKLYIVDMSTTVQVIPNKTATNWFIDKSSLNAPTVTNQTGSLVAPLILNSGLTGVGTVTTFSNAIGSEVVAAFDTSDDEGVSYITFSHKGVIYWTIAAETNEFSIRGSDNILTFTPTDGLEIGDSAHPTRIRGDVFANNLKTLTGQFTNIIGSNYLSGRFASLAGAYSSLVNGNNAGIPTGTNSVLELSGGTTIAQIAGFAATGDGDEFEARFTGAITNWIVNEANSAFATDATAGNRIKTGTGGDITLTNQPAWARFRYRSSRWELKDYSR